MADKLNLRGVHVFRKVKGTQQFRLAETHPALRLASDENELYIQGGKVYASNGEPVTGKLPEWFHSQVALCSPAALREVGYAPQGRKAA